MKKLRLTALLALPVALGAYLNSAMSWKPRALAAYQAPVLSVSWSPDGKQLASAGGDGNVSVWDAGSMRLERVLRAKPGQADEVVFSPDGKWLAAQINGLQSGGADRFNVWDSRTGALRRTRRSAATLGFAISGDGKTLASSGYVGVTLWNGRAARSKASWRAETAQFGLWCSHLMVRPSLGWAKTTTSIGGMPAELPPRVS